MGETHRILGDKVRIYRRESGENWFCATFIAGKNRRKSTKVSSLSKAKEVAEDWYFQLLDKDRHGEILNEHTFNDAAKKFMQEYEVLTNGQRNKRWVQDHYRRIRMHLSPCFGNMGLSKINAGTVQEYRIFRFQGEGGKKVPSQSTLHHETVHPNISA